jgi:hypothetical protein
MRWLVITMMMLGLVGSALGDEPAPTVITGRVTDVVGRAVANARVHVVPRDGQGTAIDTTTDTDGRYRVEVSSAGAYGVVIGIDKAHAFRTVLVQPNAETTLDIDVELDTMGGEVINIVDPKRPRPAVKAKPQKDPRLTPPYSDEAISRDAWARAWLLLDIDETGQVTRVKLLKAPGFDLDKICLETAFALTFDPAKDGEGRPMKQYLLWSMEWPAWGWLVQGAGGTVRIPTEEDPVAEQRKGLFTEPQAAGMVFAPQLGSVPCAGSGPLNLDRDNRAYRDCAKPDLRNAFALPWITKASMATALVEIRNGKAAIIPGARAPKPRVLGARWPRYLSLGVTGAFAVASVASYLQFDKYQSRVTDATWEVTADPMRAHENDRQTSKWARVTLGLTGATMAAGAITLLLWNRDQGESTFTVQPSGSGATATYMRGW